ncbi:GPW/gp25 family protein [Roseomonas marmotae]|uniref:GPW/gp25 family protein n=1 Tax=Roseomonas marmotae TaxID=2768161 RepID=A0ABS3KIM3_9PROT|nr:GPW/gp25 family protein [Roseomonas marmotae]MBO1076176.1 GPW/gp25 family protein [Roseomonas marmotae]QTI81788.1 GPW/gp25 family protein [Roseomonas marmotae]
MARPFLGRGVGFPFRVGPRGNLPWVEGAAAVERAIWIILSTARGEMPMQPRFGCGIQELVFADNTPASRGVVAQLVTEALSEWEPRIDLVDIRVREGGEQTVMAIEIDYRLRADNAFFNLVYPFYPREGRS